MVWVCAEEVKRRWKIQYKWRVRAREKVLMEGVKPGFLWLGISWGLSGAWGLYLEAWPHRTRWEPPIGLCGCSWNKTLFESSQQNKWKFQLHVPKRNLRGKWCDVSRWARRKGDQAWGNSILLLLLFLLLLLPIGWPVTPFPATPTPLGHPLELLFLLFHRGAARGPDREVRKGRWAGSEGTRRGTF